MKWTLDQLATFVAAAEAASFSAAARKLGRAQSAVSTAIAMLEASLDTELFDRSGRTPSLTEAGRALLDEARELMRQCRHFDNRALALATKLPGQLTLALDEGLPYPAELALVQALDQAFPHLELTLFHGSAANIAEWLLAGKADVGLAFRRLPPDAALVSQPVGAVPRVLVVGSEHALVHEPGICRQTLARHRQLLVTPRFAHDDADERISPQLWRADSLYVIAEQAAMGLGWAVLPLNIARYPTQNGRLVEIHAQDLVFAALEVHLYWRAGQEEASMLQWLRRYLANAVFARDVGRPPTA
ncbi:LysR family transcriptional regulator [Vogesella sp. LIG4]|uniref:LysR family transcriptional regulator n=1 Tax=Vogesella sp. LIG4 TaxID=1192162 RepID=UPI0008200604|nr:LysR family transcriptional regulator [Vogesella sp. LIG4]SCK28329.1 DNA-binding transcriptional regulator, LysR family [Vogesella sp. LIG4]